MFVQTHGTILTAAKMDPRLAVINCLTGKMVLAVGPSTLPQDVLLRVITTSFRFLSVH